MSKPIENLAVGWLPTDPTPQAVSVCGRFWAINPSVTCDGPMGHTGLHQKIYSGGSIMGTDVRFRWTDAECAAEPSPAQAHLQDDDECPKCWLPRDHEGPCQFVLDTYAPPAVRPTWAEDDMRGYAEMLEAALTYIERQIPNGINIVAIAFAASKSDRQPEGETE